MKTEFPHNTILIVAGRVRRVQTWVTWSGKPFCTIDVALNSDSSYTSHIGDPEHGGCTKDGTLEEVLAALHAGVAASFLALFALEEPAEAAIAATGFSGYQINSLAAAA